jgi:hypothetical protein
MTLHVSGATVTGTIVFGSGSLPPATDPNVGYPPGVKWWPTPPPYFLGEGFAYTIVGGKLDGTRLQFGVGTTELWAAWCALQTPVPWDATSYDCLPNWASGGGNQGCFQTNPMTNMTVPVDCGKLYLCDQAYQTCTCTASSCAIRSTPPDTSFDMQLGGTKADGSTSGYFGDHNVHFTKM